MSRNLEEKFLVLRKGPLYSKSGGYNTRHQAIDDGAVILTYGWVLYKLLLTNLTLTRNIRAFFESLVNFIGIGVVLYFIGTVYGYLSKDSIIKHTVKCRFCRKEISSKVRSIFVI